MTLALIALSGAALNEYFYVDDIEIEKVPAARIMANDTNDWTAPALSEEFTWAAGNLIASFASTTKRLWRFEIDDPASAAGYIQIGRVGLYTAFSTAEPLDRAIKDALVDTSRVTDGPSGQRFSNLGRIDQVYELKFGLCSDQLRQQLKAIYRQVGKHTAVIVIPDADMTRLPPLYAHLETDVAFTGAGGWLWRDEVMRFKETH